jgi:hypothetical protein
MPANLTRLLAEVPSWPAPGEAEAIPDGVRTTKGGLELDT